MTLKVPYNFVPLNEKVVKPYWINHISHDIPFKDGKSGTLTLTLTAESPIFVRKGEAKDESNEQKTYGFERDANGNYFLPGSSTRGMIRSLVETLSFGRMIGRVSERRYAVRDLSNSRLYTNHFKPGGNDPVQCGWLKKEGSEYFIYGCGEPGRISHRSIEQHTGVPMEQYFTKGTEKYRDSEKEQKSALFKYDLFEKNGRKQFLDKEHYFVRAKSDLEKDTEKDKRKVYTFSDDNQHNPGKLVFTGQPDGRNNNRTPPTGKRLEFIFFETGLENKVLVNEETMNDFRFAYFDHRPTREQSEDYKKWNKILEEGGPIPVFYKFKEIRNGRPNGVKHFGLSYLYKLPYDNTVEDSIRHSQKETAENYDLADAIFGMAGTNKKNGESDFLKGRVQFSHAKVVTSPTVLKEEKVILGEPRASFYPTYMAQKVSATGNVGSYKTFMDKSPIAGRKRYPVLNGPTRKTRTKDEKGKDLSEKVFTKFLPLDKGTQFKCELHYHNLRKVELGALLSAITFHGTQQSRHQIGMGKPLGFGKVKIEVDGLSIAEQQELMLCYEAYMDMALGGEDNSWRNSAQVKEVIALTVPVIQDDIPTLKHRYPYNQLSDFKTVKNNNEGLPRHSTMRGGSFQPELDSVIGQKADDISEFKNEKEEFDQKKIISSTALKCDIKEKLKKHIKHRIQDLKKHADDIVRAAEQERSAGIEDRRKAEKEQKEAKAIAARNEAQKRNAERVLIEGPNYANLSAGPTRKYWQNLNKSILDFLEQTAPVYTPPINGPQLPEQLREELKEKIALVKARQKPKEWKKKFSEKESDVKKWLGESFEITL
ncbi:TIGR03986 family type III CRISPR-associated RAMP protein [Neolewinella agarilytica]|uniref:CRISPR-associated protein n=1 Tax=Neolewinella agarilytica TaxID=478744 RepID=A0A1H8Z8C9_9BACT|nr:TIGR03986 family CRISPR-associated RAMP protein [Neolewinella agarilytica]SEP60642.1 CRISPR-associated protein [Neolewinella agarilytica]